MFASQIQQVGVGQLRPHPSNVHTHSKKQIAQIARSIEQVGFIAPVITNEKEQILAGHGRWLAAKQQGLRTVSVITVSGLSEIQQRAYILADNKLTENAGWDRAGLANELSQLAPLLSEAGLDIELTGFDPAELDGLLGDLVDPECDPADEVPLPAQHAVSASSVQGRGRIKHGNFAHGSGGPTQTARQGPKDRVRQAASRACMEARAKRQSKR